MCEKDVYDLFKCIQVPMCTSSADSMVYYYPFRRIVYHPIPKSDISRAVAMAKTESMSSYCQ